MCAKEILKIVTFVKKVKAIFPHSHKPKNTMKEKEKPRFESLEAKMDYYVSAKARRELRQSLENGTAIIMNRQEFIEYIKTRNEKPEE